MAAAESGNGWFHKPLDGDMCAATLDGGEKKQQSSTSENLPSSEGTLVQSTSTEPDGANAD